MSRTILQDVNGFTPLIDSLVDTFGVNVAAVFGRVWRYCQMESGVCFASVETIAEELQQTRATVGRHLKTLVEHGYLIDMTPKLRNKPHTYMDAGKVVMKSVMTAAEANQPAATGATMPLFTPEGAELFGIPDANGVLNLYTKDENGVLNLYTGVLNLYTKDAFGVLNLYMKIEDIKIESKKERPRANARAAKPVNGKVSPPAEKKPKKETIPAEQLRPMVLSLASVTGMDLKIKDVYGRLARTAKQLVIAGYSPDAITDTYGAGGVWYTHDWRGQRNEPPGPDAVSQTIGRLKQIPRGTPAAVPQNGNGGYHRKTADAPQPAGAVQTPEEIERKRAQMRELRQQSQKGK